MCQIFPGVLRALKNKAARLSLVEELSYHIKSNRAQLEHQQFDLVVKLLNCALQVICSLVTLTCVSVDNILAFYQVCI
jgi:hypothetical protein